MGDDQSARALRAVTIGSAAGPQVAEHLLTHDIEDSGPPYKSELRIKAGSAIVYDLAAPTTS